MLSIPQEFIAGTQAFHLGQDEMICASMFDFRPFLCQKFEPTMITEYFVGWTTRDKGCFMQDKKLFEDESYIIQIKHSELYNKESDIINIIEGEYHSMLLSTFIPKTLDQFISNCQQAGIKLTWKGL